MFTQFSARLISWCSTLMLIAQLPAACADESSISLSGTWKFQLDNKDIGTKEKWFNRALNDSVRLPGTTDENRKGILQDEKPTDRLARAWFWKGAAWYQREVTIPQSWAGKRITLFFERSKNSRVWVNDLFCGREDSLSAPHVFDVTKAMTTGTHTITVLVDNAKLPPVGPAHAVDERTQTNWNGIVGRMELRATAPVWIEDVQVFPDVSNNCARVRMSVGNITGRHALGSLRIDCKSFNVDEPQAFKTNSIAVNADEPWNTFDFIYQPDAKLPLWDEFDPILMKLDLELSVSAGEISHTDRRAVRFGMREFTRDGNLLKNNGRTVFLRGRLDCANYPLTGYAPMEKTEWRRLLQIQKDWGLNHIRFHSWCPPAAAFEAADELGFYLQVELPNKRSAFNAQDNKDAAVHNIDWLDENSDGAGVSLFDYGKREGDLIMRHFGNNPSFVLFTLGNELGRTPGMFDLVAHFKQSDPRRLHAQGSNNMHWNPSLAEGDDFWVTGKVEKDRRPLRGSFSLYEFPDPHIETHPPSTLVDFRKSLEGVPIPLIGHETGQFQVFPDFRDIPKFTGVLRARKL
jgi:beta-galactosidase/beta-glucuronidase